MASREARDIVKLKRTTRRFDANSVNVLFQSSFSKETERSVLVGRVCLAQRVFRRSSPLAFMESRMKVTTVIVHFIAASLHPYRKSKDSKYLDVFYV